MRAVKDARMTEGLVRVDEGCGNVWTIVEECRGLLKVVYRVLKVVGSG